MTPGAAKTRAELPWLYYPENPMIINAHNFVLTGFDPSVNGKTPIACWCPSQDTAGQGTTTLTDLVGSNHGTLTNMDPSTDWVVDDGKYALDFNGSNDYVAMVSGFDPNVPANVTISAWVKVRQMLVYGSAPVMTIGTANYRSITFGLWNRQICLIVSTNGSSWTNITFGGSFQPVDTWLHLSLVHTANGVYTGYVNGVAIGSFTTTSPLLLNNTITRLGAHYSLSSTYALNGWLDDIRIFDTNLTLADLAAIVAAGRGGNA